MSDENLGQDVRLGGSRVPVVLDLDAADPQNYPNIRARLVVGSDLVLVLASNVDRDRDVVLASNTAQRRLATLAVLEGGSVPPMEALLALVPTAERLFPQLLVTYAGRSSHDD